MAGRRGEGGEGIEGIEGTLAGAPGATLAGRGASGIEPGPLET